MLEPRIDDRKITVKELVDQLENTFVPTEIDPEQASVVFELVLLGAITFKPFIYSADNQNYIYVNCKHELSSLYNICKNKIKLTNLKFYDRYNSLYFKDLPKGVQRYFNSIEITYSFMWVKISNEKFEILQKMLNNE